MIICILCFELIENVECNVLVDDVKKIMFLFFNFYINLNDSSFFF